MIWEAVRLALSSIRRNLLRSFLTLLGIVIGVAAVIAMITIGSGTTQKVKDDIAKLGSNLLVVRAGGPPAPGGPRIHAAELDDDDVKAIAARLPDARAVSAAAQSTARVIYGTDSLSVSITGADTGYFAARDWGVSVGREFTEQEERGGATVCLLGQTVRSQFFGAGDPTDRQCAWAACPAPLSACWRPKDFQALAWTRI
jgi:putative ABC transport system permease protein